MQQESDSKEVILFGRTFNRVNRGLDEREVVRFFEEVLSKNSADDKAQKPSASVDKLIEKIVGETEAWAEQTKIEAKVRADDEAKVILAKAEEQARKYYEQRRNEAVVSAQKEADFLKHQAKIEIESWLKEMKDSVAAQLRGIGSFICKEMTSQADSMKKKAANFENELNQKITNILKRELVIEDSGYGANDQTAKADSRVEAGNVNRVTAGATNALHRTEDTNEIQTVELEFSNAPVEIIGTVRENLSRQPEILDIVQESEDDNTLLSLFISAPLDLVKILMSLPEVTQVASVTESERARLRVSIVEKPVREGGTNGRTTAESESGSSKRPKEIPLNWEYR